MGLPSEWRTRSTSWPQVTIGSYPRFHPAGPEVEIVLKSKDAKVLSQAVAWLEPELASAASTA